MNATTIGSLPYKDPQKALDVTLKYINKLPAWPQLPKRTFRENMYVQYSESFPGIAVEDTLEKIYVDTTKAFGDFEKFYENYLAGNLDYFSISSEYASGMYLFAEMLEKNSNDIIAIKGQCTGPLTFGLTVKDTEGRAIFHDTQLRDVVIKHIIMKSVWQINFLKEKIKKAVVFFLDEPYLAAYGSAFTALSKEEAEATIKEAIDGIKTLANQQNLLLGIHCCANTDWSLLLDSNIDIISFDGYEFFDNLLLYIDKIKSFLKKGGQLAWGIVPTSEEALSKENTESLLKRLLNSTKQMEDKGIDIKKIKDGFLFTPACGLGSRSEEAAETALRLTSEIVSRAQSAL